MHRRKHDVIWWLLPQLHDELTQIGLNNLEARMLQCFIEMNLLRGHRLGFDDGSRVFLANDAENDLARLLSGAGPMNFRAARFEV